VLKGLVFGRKRDRVLFRTDVAALGRLALRLARARGADGAPLRGAALVALAQSAASAVWLLPSSKALAARFPPPPPPSLPYKVDKSRPSFCTNWTRPALAARFRRDFLAPPGAPRTPDGGAGAGSAGAGGAGGRVEALGELAGAELLRLLDVEAGPAAGGASAAVAVAQRALARWRQPHLLLLYREIHKRNPLVLPLYSRY